MQLCSTQSKLALLDDKLAELHENICGMKTRADNILMQTGVYPNTDVIAFCASLKADYPLIENCAL
jgi:hypothetical protein